MIVVSAAQAFPNSGISSLSWSAASTWRVPRCQQAGVFSLPFYEPRLAERVCQSASNSAGVEVTRSGIESFAPDILRIFPHRGCRDQNVQKTIEWQKQARAWEPSCRTLRGEVPVLVFMCPSWQLYIYGSCTKASNHLSYTYGLCRMILTARQINNSPEAQPNSNWAAHYFLNDILEDQDFIATTPCFLGWVTSEAACAWNVLCKLPAAFRMSGTTRSFSWK